MLEEISETGEYILQHQELYPYVERKIAGGMNGLKNAARISERTEKQLHPPDMIKEDAREVEKMKQALGGVDKAADPTVGAGMGMEQLMENPMQENNVTPNFPAEDDKNNINNHSLKRKVAD